MKIYIVVAVWGNTKSNHAGMYYLAKSLKNKYPKNVVIIPTPTKGSRFLSGLYRFYNYLIGLYLRVVAKKDDTVFLMEYLLRETEQSDIAKLLNKRVNVVALAHLVPDRIQKLYSDEEIRKRVSFCSRLYVLGSSLKSFFIRKGIDESKVIVTFHYVDNEYYSSFDSKPTGVLNVICMGNMERDHNTLLRIIKQLPTIHFILCKGNAQLSQEFYSCQNLEIHGFISESELRDLMRKSHISLNVMKDTIGSNVITTSLACGLAVVASKVGSITDYVTDGQTGFLFANVEECVEKLSLLNQERDLLKSMENAAIIKSESISLASFIKWFEDEFIQKRY